MPTASSSKSAFVITGVPEKFIVREKSQKRARFWLKRHSQQIQSLVLIKKCFTKNLDKIKKVFTFKNRPPVFVFDESKWLLAQKI